MLGAGLQFERPRGDDRFYDAAKARRSHQHFRRHQNPQGPRGGGGSAGALPTPQSSPASKGEATAPENRTGSEAPSKPAVAPPLSNLDRFLQAATPSVPAQYLSKRWWRTCGVEFRPYFALEDLWESFKEWSAYGAGVSLVLNGSDSVVQYYVPYLSGIQLYGESSRQEISSRRLGEESDGDCYRDSSSDASSDCELERGLKYPMDWNQNLECVPSLRINGLSLRGKDVALQEGFSSDDSEVGNSQGCLLFQYFEQDPPYCREPLADKISDLAHHFPALKTLRSCDLLPASWVSVAWYPIYRIPTGSTLRDLDACFLTFHSFSTLTEGVANLPGSTIAYPQGVDGVPMTPLPIFGLASYKLKGSVWMPNGGRDRQLANSLLQAADKRLRLLQVDHPDYQFFMSNGSCRR